MDSLAVAVAARTAGVASFVARPAFWGGWRFAGRGAVLAGLQRVVAVGAAIASRGRRRAVVFHPFTGVVVGTHHWRFVLVEPLCEPDCMSRSADWVEPD